MRRQKNAAHAGKDGVPDIDTDGDAGQIDCPCLTAEYAGKDSAADLGHLGEQQWEEQRKKMPYLV